MSLKLVDYQQKLSDDIKIGIRNALKANLNNCRLILNSPTGSGKTVIMGSVIKELTEQDCIHFVWISIGSGGLEKQSYQTFLNELDFDENEVYLFDNLNGFDSTKKVVFSNWTYLKSSKKDSNVTNYECNFTESSSSFLKVINELKSSGNKVVLVIDESHHTSSSALSTEIISKLKCDLVMEITATPKNDLINYQGVFAPARQEVRDSGVVKQGVNINDCDLSKILSNNDLCVLENAESKRLAVANEYKNLGDIIPPLVIVQCNNEESDKFKNLLQGMGILDNEIAEYFYDKRTNYDDTDIKLHNSKIKYLLCNKAISTGWDCPRAHILVQFIRVASDSFEIQVVGRILRTVGQKFYNNPIIDTGYVFTYFDDNKAFIEEYKKCEFYTPIRTEIECDTLVLNSFNNVLATSDIKKESIKVNTLSSLIVENSILVQNQYNQYIKNNTNLLTKVSLFSNYKKNITGSKIDIINGINTKTNIGLAVSFDLYCKDMLSKYNLSRTTLDTLIIPYCKNNNIDDNDVDEDLFKLTKNFELSIIKQLRVIGEEYQILSCYNILNTDNYSLNVTKSTHYDISGNFVQKLSKPEEIFVNEYLEKNSDIKYLFKNFDNGSNALSFVYEIDNTLHLHSPDFICIDTKDKLRLFEIKENTDSERTSLINEAKFHYVTDLVLNKQTFTYDLVLVETNEQAKRLVPFHCFTLKGIVEFTLPVKDKSDN